MWLLQLWKSVETTGNDRFPGNISLENQSSWSMYFAARMWQKSGYWRLSRKRKICYFYSMIFLGGLKPRFLVLYGLENVRFSLNRKRSRFVQKLPRAKREAKKKREVNRLRKRDWSANRFERKENWDNLLTRQLVKESLILSLSLRSRQLVDLSLLSLSLRSRWEKSFLQRDFIFCHRIRIMKLKTGEKFLKKVCIVRTPHAMTLFCQHRTSFMKEETRFDFW